MVLGEATARRFEIRTTSGKGKGMYARSSVRKGAFILEYTGKPYPTEVADTMDSRYLFDLENGTTLDGVVLSNEARWINHSCDPNCEAILEDDHIMIYTCKHIKEGEELTFDYGQEYFDEFFAKDNCLCGAKKHRKPKSAKKSRAADKKSRKKH